MLSGALIASVTGIYILIVLGASALVPGGSSRLWPLVAAVAVALLLQPVRGRLEQSVNRLFYGQRDDPVISSGRARRLKRNAILTHDIQEPARERASARRAGSSAKYSVTVSRGAASVQAVMAPG